MIEWVFIWILNIETPTGELREVKSETKMVSESQCSIGAKFKQKEFEQSLGQQVNYGYASYSPYDYSGNQYGRTGKLVGFTIGCEPRKKIKWTRIK
jgi:hypothetical protein